MKKVFKITGDKAKYVEISQEEAKRRLDTEKDIILLDVRTTEEFKEKHIPNSMLIPVDIVEKEIESKISDKESTIFIYCRSGQRSKVAAQKAANLGYKNVYEIGGIISWKYETQSGL